MTRKLLQLIKDNFNQVEGKLTIVNADDEATIFLYDVIDDYWGISALEFSKELISLKGKKVTLRINSPGGDVFAAEAMANAIREHGNVHGKIDGWAASAATRVTNACQTREIAPAGFYMIHNAWTFAYGNKFDMQQTGDLLSKVDETIINDYEATTGQTREQIMTWMDAETWFNAEEAVQYGFVDKVSGTEDTGSAASATAKNWNFSAYKNAPEPKAPPKPNAMEELLKNSQVQLQANANRLRLLEIT